MKIRTILFLLGIIIPAGSVSAQEVIEEPASYSIQGRLSAMLDKKLAKGVHLQMGEEVRLPGDVYTMQRSYSEIGLTYKVNPYLKLGAAYDLIVREHKEDDGGSYRIRHRGQFDVTGMYDLGAWRFSLRERFKATYNTADINPYQSPKMPYALCSRIKAKYNHPAWAWSPYAFVELRNTINNSRYDGQKYSYDDAYVNRVRLSLGAEWRIDKKNYLDFYTLWDYKYDKDLDATRKGRFKSLTIQESYCLSLGIAYKFAL